MTTAPISHPIRSSKGFHAEEVVREEEPLPDFRLQRRLRVADLHAHGYSNRRIAETLNMPLSTVKLWVRTSIIQNKKPLLTPRQVEILQRVFAGYSNEEISEALGIRRETVKTHLRDIFQNLDCARYGGFRELVARALRLGLLVWAGPKGFLGDSDET